MWWALKSPEGIIFPNTLGRSKTDVWAEAFMEVASREKGFSDKYWHRWDASLRAAKKLGYSIVKVELIEIKDK